MGLVVPFTACQSQGGPFEDDAFVHGFDVGALHAEMQILAAVGATPRARWLKPGILDQADLFAMHHGYVMKRGETEPAAGWVHVEFTSTSGCDHGSRDNG